VPLRTISVVVEATEYDLWLAPDTAVPHPDRKGHTQWFFFSVRGMVPGKPVRFNIWNMEKPGSLFKKGMQPLVYSTRAAAGLMRAGDDSSSKPVQPCGWHRDGSHIIYREGSERPGMQSRSVGSSRGGSSSAPLRPTRANQKACKTKTAGSVKRAKGGKRKGGDPNDATEESTYYRLEFTLEAKHPDDTIYIAQAYPYTYTTLQRKLAQMETQTTRPGVLERQLLCTSVGGRRVTQPPANATSSASQPKS
jgi:hypothetical protein